MHALFLLHEVLFRIKRETRGAVAAEYAFLIVFIAIVSVTGMLILGTGLSDYFSTLGLSIGTSAQQGT